MLVFAKQHQNFDIILGSRFLSKNAVSVPLLKRLLLRLAVLHSNLTNHIQLSDAHNGLRVLNREVAKNIDLRLTGMAHASEFIQKIAVNHYSFAEFPIKVSYTKYSQSKGQPMINSVNIAIDLIFSKVDGQ